MTIKLKSESLFAFSCRDVEVCREAKNNVFKDKRNEEGK